MDGLIIIIALLGVLIAYCIQEIIRLKIRVESLEAGIRQCRLYLETDINRVEMALHKHIRLEDK